MSDHRSIVRHSLITTLFAAFLLVSFNASAQDGKALFKLNCAGCHGIDKAITGPALRNVQDRWPTKELLHAWIKNNAKLIQSGDPTANKIKDYSSSAMSIFENLSDGEIDAILAYINSAPAAGTPTDPNGGGVKTDGSDSDSALLYGILTLILAVVALILLQVNGNLRKLADDKEGIPSGEPIPFYRNKTYITLLTLVLFVVSGFFLARWGIGMGRNKNYQPEQPIYYSHKVHAGTNQINCLYCHGGAYEGKHANIPSPNMCMNCHMQINEYTGADKMFREDGTEVDGTAEIQKLYAAVGWDPATKKYSGEGKAIEWVKIHNLPDHVYFNHSQHTKAGKVQCQTCHGEITKMDEVYQFSELSMGWCVNCHRETKVDFNYDEKGGNKFYSIYEKFHNKIKAQKKDNMAVDSVTVEAIGGLECQKCHY